MLLYFCITCVLMATLLLFSITKHESFDKAVDSFNDRFKEDEDYCKVTKNEFIILCVAMILFGWVIIPVSIAIGIIGYIKKVVKK